MQIVNDGEMNKQMFFFLSSASNLRYSFHKTSTLFTEEIWSHSQDSLIFLTHEMNKKK